MNFAHTNGAAGGKAGKFALVAGLHALLAMGVIQTMNSRTLSLPALLDDPLVWVKPEVPPPSPPPQPPTPPTPSVAPRIVVPPLDIDIAPPPPQRVALQATTDTEPTPEPGQPTQSALAPQPVAPPTTKPGTMRSAVLANADGCALPDYPARAARNGETGTVTLALLVGADGRVQQSRIQSSSGSRELDRAAGNALSLCRFQPALTNGVPEPGWAQIAYVWTLE